ncbi:MAG: SDR family NAD(P)-dependent oxidoreductase, partial [Desulfobacterales bacterium]|nr:SDR family NAD(P)-dependent oxidoreductase [Desulfobacterales bacterium]
QPADTKTESPKKFPSAHTDQKEITNALLAVVSELTGYPVQMLALDMDIEADLGIDSIKRVEILSTLEEKLPNLPNIAPDVMGSLKTLGQIAAYFADVTHSSETTMDKTEIEVADMHHKESETASEHIRIDVAKKVVTIVETPLNNLEKLSIPKGKIVYVTQDKNGLSEAIVAELSMQNINAELITLDAKLEKDRFPAGGLVILPPVGAPDENFLKDAFNLSRQMAPELLDSAAQGGAFFATLTRIDGAFGFKGQGFDNPLQGGLAGLVKTAAIEWKNVRCRAIDIAPIWKITQDIAKAIVNELLNPDPMSPVEIGLNADLRCTLALESAPYAQKHDIRIDLRSKDVVLITGGARGVTAAAVQALAKRVQPIIILLGRSPQPFPEPEWLQTIEGEAAIKKTILENQFKGQRTSPQELEQAFRIHTANREISQNLTKLQAAGVPAHYYSVDIRDAAATVSLINELRQTHGPIKGIIHGAGVLEDRLIIDKTPEQFEKVFDTKVKGLRNLFEATRTDHLKYLVFFSSVAARTGNKGQADYAMANEVLNKIAQQESISRPNCRVVSINWGPWDGGMVSPALKREFQRNNIDLIPMDIGAEYMLFEMAADKTAPVEVIIGANIQPPVIVEPQKNESLSSSKKDNTLKPKEKLSLTFKREIDTDRYPILKSHIIGGKPVVPFALITEWLGHGALHQNPGLVLLGLDDIRILNGIKLEEEKKLIRLLAGKARKKGSVYEVEVEVRNGIKDGTDLIHSKAKAILAESPSKPPLFTKSEQLDSNRYSRSIDEVYEDILFHGFKLRGIKSVISCSSAGMVARISTAPSPNDWIIEPLRSKWISDPLVLDCAFQMATLWCFEEMGVVSLPSYSASYRQYRQSYPPEDITVVLEVKEATRHKMKGDFTFLDTQDEVVARLTGCEAVMDASLFKAFKPHASTST